MSGDGAAADNSLAWHPIATDDDVAGRHIHRAMVDGRELAVWQADDGFVNVWENRCLHRGVRLTIGVNDGAELVCRYHGWRYASRSGGCTYIPAHPIDAPARTVTNTTFPVRRRYGLIWTAFGAERPGGEVPAVGVLDAGSPFGLRNLPVNAPAPTVRARLAQVCFTPTALIGTTEMPKMTVTSAGDDVVIVSASIGDDVSTVVYFVQPVDANRCVIRPVLAETPAEPMPVLRHHARRLAAVVKAAEASHAAVDAEVRETDPTETPVEFPKSLPLDASDLLRVTVAKKSLAGRDIVALHLEPVAGTLPAPQPGSHIDLHLPNGMVRQYSLTNGPADTERYRIGVARDAASRGGSATIHDDLEVGDELAISRPRNGFPLRRDVPHTRLIAGGIGITPLLAMAQALDRMGLDFDVHYFVRSPEHAAFAEILDGFGDRVTRYEGATPKETTVQLEALLTEPSNTSQVYACGPAPMLDAVRTLASGSGWRDDQVHFEYFANPNEIDDTGKFEVALARSARTITVPSGMSILDALRSDGVAIDASCEQGACGTCAANVIEGVPLHQDVYLNDSERAAGTTILTCVSRATSDRLVLDL